MRKSIVLLAFFLVLIGAALFDLPIRPAEAKTLAECNSEYAICSRRCFDAPLPDRFITCKRTCRANYLACGETLPITGNLPLSKGDPAKKKQKPEAIR